MGQVHAPVPLVCLSLVEEEELEETAANAALKLVMGPS